MEEKLEIALKEPLYYPDAGLSDHILFRIVSRQKKLTVINRSINLGATLLSLGFSILIIESLTSQFSQTGFYQYMSLLFSDTQAVTLYWKEFLFSLVDALPATTLVLCLGSLLLILIFGRRTISGWRGSLRAA
ncbi:MAG: hypothetical protein V4665_02915 [Patescibacteria group bacterium]